MYVYTDIYTNEYKNLYKIYVHVKAEISTATKW